MHRPILNAAIFAILIAGVPAGMSAHASDKVPAAITAAVADSGRPDADKQRDENRKPAEVVAFAGLKRGQKIADLLPGNGYFTRIFSKVVGKNGHVYAVEPAEIMKLAPKAADALNAIASDAAYGNTSVISPSIADFKAPEPLDMVWTSDNYHDLKNPFMGPADTAALDKAIFQALKPGGVYLVLDHAAASGSGARDVSTLHRIDPDLVKSEVTAAGFVLEAESKILRHSEDDHTVKVTDGAIKGKTDQFIFKFRKPKNQ